MTPTHVDALRVEKDVCKVPVVPMHHDQGRTWLYGTWHLAEAGFYSRLQAFFESLPEDASIVQEKVLPGETTHAKLFETQLNASREIFLIISDWQQWGFVSQKSTLTLPADRCQPETVSFDDIATRVAEQGYDFDALAKRCDGVDQCIAMLRKAEGGRQLYQPVVDQAIQTFGDIILETVRGQKSSEADIELELSAARELREPQAIEKITGENCSFVPWGAAHIPQFVEVLEKLGWEVENGYPQYERCFALPEELQGLGVDE